MIHSEILERDSSFKNSRDKFFFSFSAEMVVLLRLIRSKFNREFCIKHLYSTGHLNNGIPAISSPDFRIVFLGNDNFSLESLKVITNIVGSTTCLKVVISNSANIVGKYAAANQLPSVLWNDFKSEQENSTFHVGVVSSFGYLIPKYVIEKCQLGILNVHGSLLPRYRGAAPISHAIINGDAETGVSIMKIAPHRFDIGPILLRRKCPIHPDIRAPELTSLMANLGGQALKEILLNLENHITNVEAQTDIEATLAPKLTPDMSHVDWKNCSALQVYNLFRGMYGSFKLNTMYNDKKVDLDLVGLVRKADAKEEETLLPPPPPPPPPRTKTSSSSKNEDISFTLTTDFSQYYSSPVSYSVNSKDPIWDSSNNFVPGQILIKNNLVFVKCADKDGWIFSPRVKVGIKWMSGKDFQNGFISKTKSTMHLFHFSSQFKENLLKTKSTANR